jgi:16S rRNA (cytidine1402-2'-O)-methyltransferase
MGAHAKPRSGPPGTLHVVGTPIGNLGDITLRAVQTLRAVDRVAAEDTRRTRVLLSHLGLRSKPLCSLDAHATERKLETVVGYLLRGQSVALVTDAGMPSVSDPGARVVRAVAQRGLPIVVVPGPSAVTAAIALSGLVEGPFLFLGFLPRRGQKRHAALARICRTHEPVVLFEAPGRTAATLAELSRVVPERSAVICRELTKLHEEARRGCVAELTQGTPWRGEVTIVLGAAEPAAPQADATRDSELDRLIEERILAGSSSSSIVTELAPLFAQPRRQLYARVQAVRDALPDAPARPRRGG